MINIQNVKICDVIAPQVIGTVAITGVIDMVGFDQLDLIGVLAPDSNIPTAFTVAEGDVLTGSYTNITECVGGGAGGWTLWTAGDTDASQYIHFNGRMGGKRQRYVKVSITNDGDRICGVMALKSRAVLEPYTDALRGTKLVTY